MLNTTKITVPTTVEIVELAQKGYWPVLPDYTMATGALSTQHAVKHNHVVNYGQAWVRDLVNTPYPAAGLFQFADRYYGQQAAGVAHNPHYAVMPRFQNPQAWGIGTTILDGISVLTLGDKVAHWPQDNANHVATRAVTGNLPNKGVVTYQHYAKGSYLFLPHSQNVTPKAFYGTQTPEFTNGVTFDYAQDHCFTCQPVRAVTCDDGSVQCVDLLATCPFADLAQFMAVKAEHHFKVGQELNTDEFLVGEFLSGNFWQNLQRCTEFANVTVAQKLAQVQSVFPKSSLINDYLVSHRGTREL